MARRITFQSQYLKRNLNDTDLQSDQHTNLPCNWKIFLHVTSFNIIQQINNFLFHQLFSVQSIFVNINSFPKTFNMKQYGKYEKQTLYNILSKCTVTKSFEKDAFTNTDCSFQNLRTLFQLCFRQNLFQCQTALRKDRFEMHGEVQFFTLPYDPTVQ